VLTLLIYCDKTIAVFPSAQELQLNFAYQAPEVELCSFVVCMSAVQNSKENDLHIITLFVFVEYVVVIWIIHHC
jgi:hypothetical protein